ncbi:unnamed protein product [marine sediment metagenome]|uniref:Uncharacterized protein n=1 Tax=marine sediment metagenome TaxID=412755 RepID=X1I2D2_9ZZZZ
MDGLLIEFDANTGVRAGGINPNDPKLQCYGWQDLESTPAKEVRVIEDDRDIEQYEGIQGVTVLRGKPEIKQAILSICKDRYTVENEPLFLEHLRQKNIKLDDYEGWDPREILKDLKQNKKVIGIRKQSPREL